MRNRYRQGERAGSWAPLQPNITPPHVPYPGGPGETSARQGWYCNTAVFVFII